jgi:hypothetical protein
MLDGLGEPLTGSSGGRASSLATIKRCHTRPRTRT